MLWSTRAKELSFLEAVVESGLADFMKLEMRFSSGLWREPRYLCPLLVLAVVVGGMLGMSLVLPLLTSCKDFFLYAII